LSKGQCHPSVGKRICERHGFFVLDLSTTMKKSATSFDAQAFLHFMLIPWIVNMKSFTHHCHQTFAAERHTNIGRVLQGLAKPACDTALLVPPSPNTEVHFAPSTQENI
jgi:hypothetical protein